MTRLLEQWSSGDATAGERLMPLIYEQLREIADVHFRRERPDHTLQPTALVHEVFLRLQVQKRVSWESRAQFFGYSANLMRQILVDHARAKSRAKRGHDWQKVPLQDVAAFIRTAPGLLALDDALRWLSRRDATKSRIVELRFFGGLTNDEIGALLGMSASTVRRHWRNARAWLHQQLVDGRSVAL